MKTALPNLAFISAAAFLAACISLDGPTGSAGSRFTVEYDSKTGTMQKATQYAAVRCQKLGKEATLITDNPKPFNTQKRAAVFRCR